MKNLFILTISFIMLTSFGTVKSTSVEDTNTNAVYAKYSNGDITGLSGYDLLNRVDKELNCDFIANEHFTTCPYNKTCNFHAECLEFFDDSCMCFHLYGGCECSLANICVEL